MTIPHQPLLADAQQVLVGTEIVEGHDRRVLLHDRRSRHRLERLLEPGRVRLDAGTGARDAHDDVRRDLAPGGLQPADGIAFAARAERHEHAQPAVAAIAHAARARPARAPPRGARAARRRPANDRRRSVAPTGRGGPDRDPRPADALERRGRRAIPRPRSSKKSLSWLRSVSRSISWIFRIATPVWPAIDIARSRSSSANERSATRAARNPSSSPAASNGISSDEGPSPAPNRAAARVAPASRRSPRRPPARSETSEGASLDCGAAARSRACPRPPRAGTAGRVGAFSRLAVRRHDSGQQHVERLRARDGVGEPRERLEHADAPAHLVVRPGVLDRARDERGRRDQERRLVLAELARCVGEQADHAQRAARAVEQRQGRELDGLGSATREGVRAQEQGLALLGRPAGQTSPRARRRRPTRSEYGSDAARSERSPSASLR